MTSSNLPTTLSITVGCKQGAVRAVRFNVDGNYCITCGGDKTVKLWNPFKDGKGLLLKTYVGHGYEVLDACGSADNAYIISAGADKQVVVWDVATGKAVQKFRGHVGCINAVALNEESSVVFSASLDGTVRAWDMKSKSREPIQVFDEASDSVTSVCVNEANIMTASADGRVRRYDIREGQMYVDFVGKSATCSNFTKDGHCMLISTLDSTLRLLDKDTGELLNDYTGHKNVEYKIDNALLPSDAQIISGSEDGKIYIWDLVEAKVLAALNQSQSSVLSKPIHSVSAHPTRPCFLAACMDKVFVWESATTETGD